MRKWILAAAFFLMSLCFGENLSAGNFGISGGANFHTYHMKEVGMKTLTQWNAGIVYKCDLPLGFQIHPTLMYSVKEATTESIPVALSVGYLELLASVQWGIDLILFRPYLEVSPFVGYGLNRWSGDKEMWEPMNKLDYGVGVGGGLQVWRFQVAARYNWNFGQFSHALEGEKPGSVDFNGVTLSLTYFFSGKKK